MVPHFSTACVAHPLNAEGGPHGNGSVVGGEWQDVVNPLHGGDDVPHDTECVAVFSRLCPVVFTVVDDGVEDTRRVGRDRTAQRLVFDDSDVVAPVLDADAGSVDAVCVAVG